MMKKPTPSGHGAYLFFKNWFLGHYYWEMSRKVRHKDLSREPIIIDKMGRGYWEYPTGMALPLERSMREGEFMQWMGAGLDNKSLKKMTDAAQFHLMEALKLTGRPNAFAAEAAKISAILTEMSERQQRVVPLDLIINCLCVHLVREDEDPAGWDAEIHRQKCEYFMDHHTDYQFFFRFSAFKKLSSMLSVTIESWPAYLARARTEIKVLEGMINRLSSESRSSKSETTN